MTMTDAELNISVGRVAAPVRELVAQSLRQAIAEGRLTAGQRLRETDLCRLTGASRTSVREALRQLEADGLVQTQPYKGVQVAVVTPKEAASIYAVREVLEGLAGRLFTQRATDEQIAGLTAALDDFEQAHEQGDLVHLLTTKARFYGLLVAGADNPILGATLEPLNIRITSLRATSMTAGDRPKHSLAELRAVLAAIRNRDAEQAERLCKQHVRNAAEAALHQLS